MTKSSKRGDDILTPKSVNRNNPNDASLQDENFKDKTVKMTNPFFTEMPVLQENAFPGDKIVKKSESDENVVLTGTKTSDTQNRKISDDEIVKDRNDEIVEDPKDKIVIDHKDDETVKMMNSTSMELSNDTNQTLPGDTSVTILLPGTPCGRFPHIQESVKCHKDEVIIMMNPSFTEMQDIQENTFPGDKIVKKSESDENVVLTGTETSKTQNRKISDDEIVKDRNDEIVEDPKDKIVIDHKDDETVKMMNSTIDGTVK